MTPPEEPEDEATWRNLWRLFERPELPILTALFLALGVALGVFALPPTWDLPTRIGAGLALGAAAVLSFFANRMIGGRDFEG